MFTTPLRSENMPPIAPKTSGVENTNIDAISEAVKTMFRFDVLDRVARMPRPIPISAAATAPQPRRRRPRSAVESPSVAAATPTTIGQRIERSAIGGSARKQAKTPSTMPATPAVRGSRTRSQTGVSNRCANAFIGQPLAYERVEGVWGNREVPPHETRRRGFDVGETWFPPRERAEGERRSYRRPPQQPPRVPHVEDEHVGADEEHDQPLDHVGEVAGEVGRDHVRREAVRRSEEKCPEEKCGETGPDSGVASEERDGDAEEADHR